MQLTTRSRALVTLLLSVPFTSIGAILSLWLYPGTVGQIALVLCQVWLLFLTVVWLLWVEQKPLTLSKPKRFDGITGLIIGGLMFGIILAVYGLFLKDWLDFNSLRSKLQELGNVDRFTFRVAAFYFIVINTLIEEYFWRWFVYSRCEELIASQRAVYLTAVFFSLHHAIGLAAFADWPVVILGTLAVFIAGAVWSEYYRRYRSIWSNYLSHVLADLALYWVAWQILFQA